MLCGGSATGGSGYRPMLQSKSRRNGVLVPLYLSSIMSLFRFVPVSRQTQLRQCQHPYQTPTRMRANLSPREKGGRPPAIAGGSAAGTCPPRALSLSKDGPAPQGATPPHGLPPWRTAPGVRSRSGQAQSFDSNSRWVPSPPRTPENRPATRQHRSRRAATL